ncbi:MAG TPA: hypothetical protein VGI19_14160 [Candidatus Cybelea sp.]
MKSHHHRNTWVSAAVVFLTACSGAQPQGTLPVAVTSKAATQNAIGPFGPARRRLLYVATVGSRRFPGITVYSQRGIAQRKIRSITQDVNFPTGLAVDTRNNLYVGNLGTSTVTVYPSGGMSPSETLTDAGAPYGVAVARDGTVYVANHSSKSPSILVYQKGQTTPSQTIPVGGSPFELALDSHGNLFATAGAAVYEFKRGSSHGKKLHLRGLRGQLTGIAFDNSNNLLVVDNHKNSRRVVVFPYGRVIASATITIGSAQGVIGIAINYDNTEIWVTTASGGVVQGISYPRGRLLDVLYTGGLETGVAASPASNK